MKPPLDLMIDQQTPARGSSGARITEGWQKAHDP